MGRRSREQWTTLVDELEASGQPLSTFCARRGLPLRTLRWWRWKLATERRLTPQSTPPVRMLTVDVVESAVPADAEDEVVLDVGAVTMRVRVGTSPTYIAALIAALRA